MAIAAVGRLIMQPLFKVVGKQIVKEGGDKALKEFLDKSFNKLLGKEGGEALRKALEEAFSKGGGALLRQGLNLLEKGLGSKVEDALSTLLKTGKFTDLTNDQMMALGEGLLKLGGFLI
jgi:hypothetical protein